jgi:hypothetical protein
MGATSKTFTPRASAASSRAEGLAQLASLWTVSEREVEKENVSEEEGKEGRRKLEKYPDERSGKLGKREKREDREQIK